MTLTPLDCLQCGTEYAYIGAGPHPAECPDCGSACVSPVGILRITNSDYWSVPNGTGQIQIHAVDERERSFEFQIGFHKSKATLTTITIDGTSISAKQCSTAWPVAELLNDSLGRYGIDELTNPMKSNNTSTKHR
jgi:hypothetical protein